MLYTIEVHVSFSYHWRKISFKKTFELPFIPFYNMGLIFDDEKEYIIYFYNNDNCTTNINYSINNEQFEIDVVHDSENSVSVDTINDILEKYSSWKRTDDTDIKYLLKLVAKFSK
jgi:hypothetical protein